MSQGLEYVKQKSQPWIDLNRRGQILILFFVTYLILFLRLVLYFASGINFLWFISPDYITFDYGSVLNESGIYLLNLVAFGLMFYWVSRVVFSDVRNEVRVPMTKEERFVFVFVSSVCLLTLNFALDVSALFTSPLIVLCAGFFLTLWIVSVLMDRFILSGTYLRLYFKYLLFIIAGIILVDILLNLLIKAVNT